MPETTDHWVSRLQAILDKTKFYDQLEDEIKEVISEMKNSIEIKEICDDQQYDRSWGIVFGLLMQVHPEWDMNRTSDETIRLCDYIKRGREEP